MDILSMLPPVQLRPVTNAVSVRLIQTNAHPLVLMAIFNLIILLGDGIAVPCPQKGKAGVLSAICLPQSGSRLGPVDGPLVL